MKKRIIFSNHSISPFTSPIIQTLKKLNFETVFYDYAKPSLIGRVAGFSGNIGLVDRNKKNKIIDEQINLAIINLVDKFKPDYLFVYKGKNFHKETIQKIRSKGVVTINWFPDYMEDFEWIKNHALDYDYFFNPCEIVVSNLKKIKIKAYYLPFGYNADINNIKYPKKYDIVFIGQYTKKRDKYFSKLTKLDFHIWGYERYWRKSKLLKNFHSEASFSDTVKIIKSAKIVVNVLTCEDWVPIRSVNYRVFETTGLGTFLLNWYHEPIDKFFKSDKEIVNFKTAIEAFEKAKYYLSHESEREKIALAGWRRAVKDHSFSNRLREMFKITHT